MTDRALRVELLATLGSLLLVTVAVLAGIGGPVRTVFGGVLVLFAPGYAASTLLFPAVENAGIGSSRTEPAQASLPFVERLAFSVGASVASVPVLAWMVAGFGYQYSIWTTAGVVGVLSLVLAVLGGVRRLRTPADDRYVVTGETVLSIARRTSRRTPIERASTVALVLSVTFAVSVVIVGFVAPMQGGGFTQVSVLAAGEDGLQLAGESTERIEPGEAAEFVFRLENHENEQVQYTVVVEFQRIVTGDVVERAHGTRFSNTVDPGETWQRPHQIRPFTGETVRIAYLVYRGDPPAEPSRETAYRTVTVGITVSDTATGVESDAQGDGG